MNKIGMHVHSLTSEAHQTIERLQPRVVIVMDPTVQWLKDIRAAAPNCYLGVRKYEEGIYFADREPLGWAEEIAEMCDGFADGAITYNEPLKSGHDDPAEMEAFDAWQVQVIQRLHENGLDALAFAFGTGQFTAAPNRVNVAEAFPLSCEVCRIIAPHDYGWPNLWQDEGWHSMRWLAWLADMENAGSGRKKVIVSECGLTHAVVGGPDEGWWTLHDNLMVAADLYLESLDWYNEQLVKVNDCIGCATFDWAGRDYGWGTFEHLVPYVIDGIEKIDHEENGGNEVKIYDFDHGPGDVETRDWAWLQSVFGDVQIRKIEDRLSLQKGDAVYKVDYLDARVGDANIIINVRDENGSPVEGVETIFGWPDAEAHGLPGNPSVWTDNGVIGLTNAEGDVGPGLGKGAYYCPPQRGAHFVWLYGAIPSDYIDGLGMLPGGCSEHQPHAHLNLGYKATVIGDNGNGGEGMWKEVNRTFTDGDSRIVLHCSGGNLYNTRGDMECGSWRLPEPVHPQTGGIFVFDTTYAEQEERTYVAWIYKLPGLERVSDEVACTFGPNKRGTYDVYLKWDENGNGNGHAERLREIADELDEIADELEPGGIDEITVHYKSGEDQIFVPKTVASLLRKVFGR